MNLLMPENQLWFERHEVVKSWDDTKWLRVDQHNVKLQIESSTLLKSIFWLDYGSFLGVTIGPFSDGQETF